MKFIAIYDDIISPDECNVITQYYEKHPNKEKGQLGYGFVDPNLKDSTDVYTRFTESLLTHRILYGALEQAYKRYESEHECMKHTDRFTLHDSFNIQRYDPGGGFKLWHHETTNFVNYPNLQTTRVLAWMVNLNDCPGGGTMFMEQDFTMEAKCGRLSLWPAGFTHVHKGQISETHAKYIATGWFNYETPNFQ